jgi:hypothetical protein
MKLRIKGNSIRVRLTKTEVDKICSGTTLEESTIFGEDIFKYELKKSDDVSELSAAFRSGTITIFLPSSLIQDWNSNDIVGFNATTKDGLYILVEKDFKCLDETTEDQSDNFENPHTTCQE